MKILLVFYWAVSVFFLHPEKHGLLSEDVRIVLIFLRNYLATENSREVIENLLF